MTLLTGFGVILAGLITPFLIAVIVISAVAKSKGKTYKDFILGARILFAYFFVIISLFAIVIGSIVSVNAMLNYYIPDSKINTENMNKINYSDDYYTEEEKIQIQEYSEYNLEVQIENEKSNFLKESLSTISFVIIAIPIFIYFSKVVKKHKDEN